MQNLLRRRNKPLASGLGVLLFLYLWNAIDRGSYKYFILGIFTSFAIQLYVLWWWLGERAKKLHMNKITINFGKSPPSTF